MGLPFFNQARLGGGIPVASHAKVTGLLMVSTILFSAGPSILGGTEKKEIRLSIFIVLFRNMTYMFDEFSDETQYNKQFSTIDV